MNLSFYPKSPYVEIPDISLSLFLHIHLMIPVITVFLSNTSIPAPQASLLAWTLLFLAQADL